VTGGAGSLVVRTAMPDDLDAVHRLERRSFDDPWSREALRGELVPDAMRRPLVALCGGVVCGYLMAWVVVDQLHILNIATGPDVRRAGVGTALLEAAMESASREMLREVTLEVRESNTSARSFYRRHGFAEVGRRRGYYADNGEDALIMSRALGDPGGSA
jgi:ribosomal-protein-alanine N-acetyltransferase